MQSMTGWLNKNSLKRSFGTPFSFAQKVDNFLHIVDCFLHIVVLKYMSIQKEGDYLG